MHPVGRRFRLRSLCMAVAVVALALAAPAAWAQSGHTVFAITPGNVLIRFQSNAPASISNLGVVTGIGPNESIRGIDFRPRTGQLICATVTTGASANSVLTTYVVDPLTAAATLIGTSAALPGAGDVPAGFDFNPTVDRIRYVNTNDENSRLNPTNGAIAGNDVDLTPAATSTIIAQAYDRNHDRQRVPAPPAAALNNPIPTTLYAIDRNDSQLAIQGGIDGSPSPDGGVITDLAPLGFNLNQANDGGFDIVPGAPPVALAALTDAADNLTRLYAIDLTPAVNSTVRATPIGLIGSGQTGVRSLAIVPDRSIVVGVDGRATPQVRVFGANGQKFELDAYAPKFKGGVRVAAGDVNGDGIADVITGSGPKQIAHVRTFDGVTGVPLTSALGSFIAFEPTFTGGVFVAAGDLNADGFDDIIVGADAGSTPRVRAFDGRNGAELASFLAFPAEFRGGVRVAAGDVDGNGVADIIAATGPGASANVKVFSGPSSTELFDFVAFDPAFTGGIHVVGGDVNGDGRADVITGAGAGGGPHVRVFSGVNANLLYDFQASQDRAKGGVRVAATDVNQDGRADIVVTFAPRVGTEVRAFDGRTLLQIESFFAYERGPKGLFVGG